MIVPGAPAFTPVRLEKRLQKIRAQNPGVTDLYAEFVHFVAATAEFDSASASLIERLLTYGPRSTHRKIKGIDRLLLVLDDSRFRCRGNVAVLPRAR